MTSEENSRIWPTSIRCPQPRCSFVTAETVDAVFAHALTLPKKEAAVEHLAVMGSPAVQEVRHGDQL